MFSIVSRAAARPIVAASSSRSSAVPSALCRSMATVKEGLTATDAWSKSCYSGIDYTINEDLPVYDAVTKFAAYNVGCLVTVDGAGAISGVVSERDYVCKIALLGKTSKETKVKGASSSSQHIILLVHFVPFYCWTIQSSPHIHVYCSSPHNSFWQLRNLNKECQPRHGIAQ